MKERKPTPEPQPGVPNKGDIPAVDSSPPGKRAVTPAPAAPDKAAPPRPSRATPARKGPPVDRTRWQR